eukprot:3050310-Prymnesium_polylepis.1
MRTNQSDIKERTLPARAEPDVKPAKRPTEGRLDAAPAVQVDKLVVVGAVCGVSAAVGLDLQTLWDGRPKPRVPGAPR